MRSTFITASILGVLAVILGAFGAHGLRPLISEDSLESYRTAVSYQFYHVFAMLAAGILFHITHDKKFRYASNAFLAGIILFSGSIYLLSTRTATGLDGISFLGPVTPLGGLFFILGWILMAIGSFKIRQS